MCVSFQTDIIYTDYNSVWREKVRVGERTSTGRTWGVARPRSRLWCRTPPPPQRVNRRSRSYVGQSYNQSTGENLGWNPAQYSFKNNIEFMEEHHVQLRHSFLTPSNYGNNIIKRALSMACHVINSTYTAAAQSTPIMVYLRRPCVGQNLVHLYQDI